MRRSCCALLALLALPGWSQKEELFGTGKAPVFREEKLDRAFARTQVARLLGAGVGGLPEAEARGCAQLLGGLLTALAEAGPALHRRDENFLLDPALQEALGAQLSPAGFPALAYLALMVRRVMIDHRLPDEWLATAAALAPALKRQGVPAPDLAKLRLLNDGLQPVDSALYTIPVLRARYQAEVLQATSAASGDVVGAFRDAYLDRDVAWGGAELVDVGVNQRRGARGRRFAAAGPEELVAVLHWRPPPPRARPIDLLGRPAPRPDPITLYARLQPRQYLDLDRLAKGQRLLVKGRLWELNRSLSEIELREAVLLADPDWAQATLARPAEVAACPAAVNELTGAAPQPGGFAH